MTELHPLFTTRLSRRQLAVLDLLAGLGFSLAYLTATAIAAEMPSWAGLVIAAGLGVPLALRRLWPVPVFCFVLVVAIVAVAAGAVGFAYIPPAYALYAVALVDTRGAWVPTSAIMVLTAVTMIGLVVAGGAPHEAPMWVMQLDEPLLGIAALGGAWTLGRAVRERRIHAMRDAGRLAEQAVSKERLRIARELHDVVTNSIGLIAVKAGVANHVLSTRPEEAHDALRIIETTSRSALVEMRHLLGVLRSTEVPELGPAPGISGLTELADRARAAGVDVSLEVRVSAANHRDGGRAESDFTPRAGNRGSREGAFEARLEGLSSGVDDLASCEEGRSSSEGISWLPGDSFGSCESHLKPQGGNLETHGGSSGFREGHLEPGESDQQSRGEQLGFGEGRLGARDGASGDGCASTQDMSWRQNVSDRRDGQINQGRHDSEGRHLDARESVELPEGVELSVYRIVQEALTNVAKHAAPAKCRVSVVAYKGEVRIEVIDDGPGYRAPLDDVSGHGLIGMRERVMMYGGVFEASGLPERGFRVAAQLPFGGAT